LNLSGTHPTIEPGLEPSREGWSEDEIGLLVHHYESNLSDRLTDLRDINTNMKYMFRLKIPLPSYWRTYVLDDLRALVIEHETSLRYSEEDFLQPFPVFSVRWLMPFIGFQKATALADHLTEIRRLSDPVGDEPPTLDWFGSNVSNRIKIALGET
jgi:hypothetical protein